jgi:hypothetical protein
MVRPARIKTLPIAASNAASVGPVRGKESSLGSWVTPSAEVSGSCVVDGGADVGTVVDGGADVVVCTWVVVVDGGDAVVLVTEVRSSPSDEQAPSERRHELMNNNRAKSVIFPAEVCSTNTIATQGRGRCREKSNPTGENHSPSAENVVRLYVRSCEMSRTAPRSAEVVMAAYAQRA